MTPTEQNLLSRFHPAIAAWFSNAFDTITPPQMMGWPAIFRHEHTLILAPTGSGKTLTAFLVCIHELLNMRAANSKPFGVHTLYISPLKALNYDIERNLEAPLTGIAEQANKLGLSVPTITTAVRTGDTPQKERQRMLREPPDILITTPESLHLLLTSERAREMLRTVEFVIVDEIHALSDNKRGTFLSILLERLQIVARQPFTRIGLSATQRPLEEIAKFLSGATWNTSDEKPLVVDRPVTIVDTGVRKSLDLEIIAPVEDFKALPDESVWPDIYRELMELIQTHTSTLIFTNGRAAAERITAEINDRAGRELAKAHHGSVSKTRRHEIEHQLKRGELTVLVATATLELGIDMGAIDLVVQVESPKSVAHGLQRVGRAGHLFSKVSKGRMIPKTRADLLEMTVIAKAMKDGDVAPIKIPTNCLDMLAQQIAAMVALESWNADTLYDVIRCAYPYRTLPRDHFIGVVEMLSGRYPEASFRELRPRISWDRINNILHSLPGTQRMVIMNGGAIPETGQYSCYLDDGHTKIGELEEEFIYERRLGEVFTLGTSQWRIKEITHDRVIVSPAPGEVARLPFWKGEYFSRSVHLGERMAQFCQEMQDRLQQPSTINWLRHEYCLDANAAQNLVTYFKDQSKSIDSIPTANNIVVECFRDELGDFRVVLMTPYGGRLHLPWQLALLAQFRQQMHVEPESLHSDIGIMFCIPSTDLQLIERIVRQVNADNVEQLIIEAIANSPFFGLRFRQNAGRAMLLPGARPGKRTPLWLHRMRSRDLLEVARRYPSFPIVMETYRESLNDMLAIRELKMLLRNVGSGETRMQFKHVNHPSPFVASMLFEFMGGYMYSYDAPKNDSGALQLDQDLLTQLLHADRQSELFNESIVHTVESRLQGVNDGYQARTPAECVELLRRIGDVTPAELAARIQFDANLILSELSQSYQIVYIHLDGVAEPQRWICTEDFFLYAAALTTKNEVVELHPRMQPDAHDELAPDVITKIFKSLPPVPEKSAAQQHIIKRYLNNHSFVTTSDICNRYPISAAEVEKILADFEQTRTVLHLPASPTHADAWIVPDTMERIRRMTILQNRRSIQPIDAAQFTTFLLRWQHVGPYKFNANPDELITVLGQMQGVHLPFRMWERDILPNRLTSYRPQWLDQWLNQGQMFWNGEPDSNSRLGFFYIDDYASLEPLLKHEQPTITEQAQHILNALEQHGALFIHDLAELTGLAPSQCTAELWDLIWTGRVTNDSFAVIRAGKPAIPAGNQQQHSGRHLPGSRRAYQRQYRPLLGGGRWSLIKSNKETQPESNNLEMLAFQLLTRYGLLCHELYHMENWRIPWSQLYQTLVKLEWRGDIRRGYFVKGLSGIQFALPRAADDLLAAAQPNQPSTSANETAYVIINTYDPANLYGAASPFPIIHPRQIGWRLLRHPNNFIVLHNGSPLLAVEAGGERLTPLHDLSDDQLYHALHTLPAILENSGDDGSRRSIKVEFYDDEPVRMSRAASLLTELGFRQEFKYMILEKKI
ncbi:DEAD/DEAH box helicase [candidate division KSB1 bacterium]|nr:DEAD/DEAH box helicase [candidate division KSB1 bacterium]